MENICYEGKYFERYKELYIQKVYNSHAYSFFNIKYIEIEPYGHKLTGLLTKECSECFQCFMIVPSFDEPGVTSLHWIRVCDGFKQKIETCSVAKMKRALL